MNQTHDINTSAAPVIADIKDLPGLTSSIFRIAGHQLLINGAQATLQAEIEARKKAFEDATAELQTTIASELAAIERYCEAHKDTLFPVKKGKRQKTFAVLQHKLQYRESTAVEAPKDAADRIKNLIANAEWRLIQEQAKGINRDAERINALAALITAMKGLLRTPEPELNKDAVKLLTNEEAINLLHDQAITTTTTDSFKVVFSFTPSPVN